MNWELGTWDPDGVGMGLVSVSVCVRGGHRVSRIWGRVIRSRGGYLTRNWSARSAVNGFLVLSK